MVGAGGEFGQHLGGDELGLIHKGYGRMVFITVGYSGGVRMPGNKTMTPYGAPVAGLPSLGSGGFLGGGKVLVH